MARTELTAVLAALVLLTSFSTATFEAPVIDGEQEAAVRNTFQFDSQENTSCCKFEINRVF